MKIVNNVNTKKTRSAALNRDLVSGKTLTSSIWDLSGLITKKQGREIRQYLKTI